MEDSNIMDNNFDCCTPFLHIVPSKVGPLTLTKAARSGRPALTVTWTAPQSDHVITKYQVQYRRSGTTGWIRKDVTSRSTTLENLPVGTGYQVQVRAVSDVGAGPYSDVGTLSTFGGMIAHNNIPYNQKYWRKEYLAVCRILGYSRFYFGG